MPNWSPVARLEDLTDNQPHHVSADGVDAVLLRVDGELRAFEGLCPHQGALLGEGELVDGQLVCPNHGWCFDATSGQRDAGDECLTAFPLREVGGHVELDLNAAQVDDTQQAALTWDDLPGPRGWPLLGNALDIEEEKLHLNLQDWAEEYGDVYRFKLGPMPIIAAADPDVIADALTQRPDVFTRYEGVEPIFEELGVGGVFSAEGESWRSQRRLAMRALNPRRLRDFFSTLRDVTHRLLERWKRAAHEERVIDLQSDLMRFTVDVTTHLAFAEKTDAIGGESSFLLDHLDPVFPLISRRLDAVVPYWRWFKLGSDRRVERGLDELREWLSGVISRTRDELDANPERAENPTNFLEAMLTARDASGEPYDEDVIFGNAITMLLAGEDTTANTLAWAVHLLIGAPDARDTLQRAVDDVLGDQDVAQSMETADDLEAVNAVANETLRLKPVAPHTVLTATEDTVCGRLEIEEGTTLVVLTRLPAMDPERVDDPDTFRPERWSDPKLLTEMQRSGAFVPFGSGPRICPGRSLALLEIRMVLSMLYKNFEVVRVGAAEEVEEVFGFTMAPRGLKVKLRLRG